MPINIKSLKKIPVMVALLASCQLSNAGAIENFLKLDTNMGWTIEDSLGVGVKVIDYRYYWSATVIRMPAYPLVLTENKAEAPWGLRSSHLKGELPETPFYVEWTTFAGKKYIRNIPLKRLIEHNKLSNKNNLYVKAYLKDEENFVVEAKDDSISEFIEIYSSNLMEDSYEDLKKEIKIINQGWFSMGIEIPKDFDTKSLYILSNTEMNFLNSDKYKDFRIKNTYNKSIRTGQAVIRGMDNLFENYIISWTSSTSGKSVNFNIPLKSLLLKLGLDSPSKKLSIYNYSHEILVRVLPDDNLEILLTPKEEFKPFTSAEVLIYSSKDTGRE